MATGGAGSVVPRKIGVSGLVLILDGPIYNYITDGLLAVCKRLKG